MAEAARVRVLSGAGELDGSAWNACAGTANPFLLHEFFTALEDSGSAVAEAGWRPVHLALESSGGAITGILPGYLKSHSQGEYVFDHGWADAFARAGGRYYPKLQHAVPFTPATGRRLLARDPGDAAALIAASQSLTIQNELSSAHATFVDPAQQEAFAAAGWLIRLDQQFHWINESYEDFEQFLGALSSRKRKAIRRERSAAIESGVEIVHLTGGDLIEAHWDAFWTFYQDTGARKWGRPYLTRAFFSLLGERMSDRVLLMLARRGGRWIAGALNLIGEDCLYGRYWGCAEDVPFLHFELCYHQAVDWAIAHRLARVEAGAQGAHKLARGYRPVPTVSAHFIPDRRFRAAVAEYLDRERAAVAREIALLDDEGPFRKSC